jgi:hypothetical protein
LGLALNELKGDLERESGENKLIKKSVEINFITDYDCMILIHSRFPFLCPTRARQIFFLLPFSLVSTGS